MKLNCGAKRHHYSMFDVGRSMLDVQLKNQYSITPVFQHSMAEANAQALD